MRIRKQIFASLIVSLVGAASLSGCFQKEFPQTAKDFDDRACEYYTAQEYDKACNDWDLAIQRKPDNPEYYWRRARACRFIGSATRLQQAVDDASKAIEYGEISSPRKRLFFLHTRAECYAARGDLDAAIDDFTTGLKLAGQSVDAAPFYMGRGKVYGQMNKPDKAIEDLTKAIELVPTWGRAYFYRGRAYDELKEYVKSAHDYLEAKNSYFDPVVDRYEPMPIR